MEGFRRRFVDLERVPLAAIRPPADDIRIPIGARTHVIRREQFGEWLETAMSGTSPLNQRRERVRSLAQRELLQRTGSDDTWRQAAVLKSAINTAWPTQKPVRLVDRLLPGPSGRRRVWTQADQLLVDEANSMLNGSPFTYGHVIVDEAQDHSAVALRIIGRRSPTGSMTLAGDVAQSTTPAGQERWSTVFDHLAVRGRPEGVVAHLTIGYRVPEPILTVANRLLAHTGVDAAESRSVRWTGAPPTWHRVMVPRARVSGNQDLAAGLVPGDPGAGNQDLAAMVAEVAVATKHRRRVSGVVAPVRLHAEIEEALIRR